MHVQRMLEMGMILYTGGNFKLNVWKNLREIENLIYDHDLTNKRFGPTNYFLFEYITRSLIA